ncbi:toll/interleukin-1 receptor domain-containing protein [Streptomyces sp. CBMA156]|uniref:toll/interleukin-1 receptor domain-containing protein n=1 Tax=Streptomyces sp. CBMA156 TaxID=1930280 RepID=UPI00294FF61B|nr:toll/interleukin-1 receptor domain-containing protein [Streptomyces sp. CBMA156]
MAIAVSGAAAALFTAGATVLSTGIDVRERLSRLRRPPDAPPAVEPAAEPGDTYDAFVSYAEADTEAAQTLATRLRGEGLRVFLAEWIGPGLVESLEKEAALRVTANGILLFSSATMNDAAIRDEYAVLLQRVHSGGQRFIPVLVEDVELPPFARIRRPADLRNPGSAPYDVSLAALVRAVRPRGEAV